MVRDLKERMKQEVVQRMEVLEIIPELLIDSLLFIIKN